LLEEADPVVLELAAKYDGFRQLGSSHAEALASQRRTKGAKCAEGREEKVLELLRRLGLLVARAPVEKPLGRFIRTSPIFVEGKLCLRQSPLPPGASPLTDLQSAQRLYGPKPCPPPILLK
jgi:hypothetical protein